MLLMDLIVSMLRHGLGIEHACEAHRLVERGLEQISHVHHALVLDILYDLVDELDLLLVKEASLMNLEKASMTD